VAAVLNQPNIVVSFRKLSQTAKAEPSGTSSSGGSNNLLFASK
jgi:hypothetical protein